jgi:hypothetical protein
VTVDGAQELIAMAVSGPERGPSFTLLGGEYLIRWQAAPRPAGSGCSYNGSLEPAQQGLPPQPFADRAATNDQPVGADKPIGPLQPGEYSLRIDPQCSWAVIVSR